MTHMEIKDSHDICTPGDNALAFKGATGISEPHLLAQSLGEIRFLNLHPCSDKEIWLYAVKKF
jgi:hypothetical protein